MSQLTTQLCQPPQPYATRTAHTSSTNRARFRVYIRREGPARSWLWCTCSPRSPAWGCRKTRTAEACSKPAPGVERACRASGKTRSGPPWCRPKTGCCPSCAASPTGAERCPRFYRTCWKVSTTAQRSHRRPEAPTAPVPASVCTWARVMMGLYIYISCGCGCASERVSANERAKSGRNIYLLGRQPALHQVLQTYTFCQQHERRQKSGSAARPWPRARISRRRRTPRPLYPCPPDPSARGRTPGAPAAARPIAQGACPDPVAPFPLRGSTAMQIPERLWKKEVPCHWRRRCAAAQPTIPGTCAPDKETRRGKEWREWGIRLQSPICNESRRAARQTEPD